MEQEKRTEELRSVLRAYFTPEPKIVGKLPRKNKQTGSVVYLDFVGHADITRILLEIDPHWRWVPIAWDNGRPAIHVENGVATMWGELTLLGQARLGVGSVDAHKADLDKELVGDFLRNAAQRFGICLSLWSKSEWDEETTEPVTPATKKKAEPKQAEAKQAEQKKGDAPEDLIPKTKLVQFATACEKAGVSSEDVAFLAGVDLGKATNADLDKLREAFNAIKLERAQQAEDNG